MDQGKGGSEGGGQEEHSLSSKELHPQQSKDHDEQEKKEEQADDGFHGVEEGDHQVPQGVPVSKRKQQTLRKIRGFFLLLLFLALLLSHFVTCELL